MSIAARRRRAILTAHGGVCQYCGCPEARHVDHIVPKHHAGTDDLGNLTAACLPCNLRKKRHRLPADAEQRALDAAEAMRQTIRNLEYAELKMLRTSPIFGSMKKDQKINVMLTADEIRLLEDVLFEERRRSVSALARDLILEALMARGKPVCVVVEEAA